MDGTCVTERANGNHYHPAQDAIVEYTYTHHRSEESQVKEAYEVYRDAKTKYWANESDSALSSDFELAEANFFNATLKGLTPEKITEYFLEAVNAGNYDDKFKFKDITYRPMKEMFSYLQEMDFQVYFVSGSVRYALYALATNLFDNIDFAHCIGTDCNYDFVIKDGKYEIQFASVGEVNVKESKVNKIITQIGKRPVIAFGNSSGDRHMLQYTITNPKYKSLGVAINHDDEEREYVYSFDKIHTMCQEIGALEVSVKNDFLTVF
ncbi:MAG: haloacid dehalogenase-like hydrolase [Bacilli bacterium]|nr:haloacid dehalogenase-like hydrolase [Bacilli bacterium]